MSLTLNTEPTDRLSPSSGLRPVAVAPGRWRVLDASGRAIGHIETHADPRGTRYRARRFHAATKRFRDIGDFWSASDALECLKHWR